MKHASLFSKEQLYRPKRKLRRPKALTGMSAVLMKARLKYKPFKGPWSVEHQLLSSQQL